MKIGSGGGVHRDLGHLFAGHSVAGLGEVQLLERYVTGGDEPAFAALVARHGPMVLGVCRRLLTDPFDVEDAFQATFLVLVRRAGSLRDREGLAPWLFGVARRVATRSRTASAKRRAREQVFTEETVEVPVGDDHHHREMVLAMIEEIERLPRPLRDPVVLCCVEGVSYEEAATRLLCTSPAIRGRLSRARERLRTRLIRRGFAPTAVAIGAMLSAEVASASVPPVLLISTVRVAIVFAAGRAASAGAVPAAVVFLAEGVIKTMILTKSKIVAVAVVALGIAGSSLGVQAQNPETNGQGRSPEAERFDRLEQKLDRLIQALEGSGRAKGVNRREADLLAPPVATAPTAAPRPAAAPTIATGPMVSNPKELEKVIRLHMATMMPPGAAMPGQIVGGAARLDAVEKKVVNLEARIAEIERRLGPEQKILPDHPESDAFRPTPKPE